MVMEATFQMFYTESRMRENCTYGSIRGRACPTRGVPLYSTLHSIGIGDEAISTADWILLWGFHSFKQ